MSIRDDIAHIMDFPSWSGGRTLTVTGVILPDEDGIWPNMNVGDTLKVNSPMVPDVEVEVRVVYIEEENGCRRWRAEAEV